MKGAACLCLLPLMFLGVHDAAAEASVKARDEANDLVLSWQGDETIEVSVSKTQGVFKAPFGIKVGERRMSIDGFYIRINGLEDGLTVESTRCALQGEGICVEHVLRHPRLTAPTRMTVTLWMEPQDRALRARASA